MGRGGGVGSKKVLIMIEIEHPDKNNKHLAGEYKWGEGETDYLKGKLYNNYIIYGNGHERKKNTKHPGGKVSKKWRLYAQTLRCQVETTPLTTNNTIKEAKTETSILISDINLTREIISTGGRKCETGRHQPSK